MDKVWIKPHFEVERQKFPLRPPWWGHLQRRPVVMWRYYNRFGQRTEEDSLMALKALFLFCLSLALSRIICELLVTASLPCNSSSSESFLHPSISEQIRMFWDHPLILKGMVILTVFTAILVICVLVKKMIPFLSQQREAEVETTSGLVQNLWRNGTDGDVSQSDRMYGLKSRSSFKQRSPTDSSIRRFGGQPGVNCPAQKHIHSHSFMQIIYSSRPVWMIISENDLLLTEWDLVERYHQNIQH